jgi:hypothetical protein
MSANPDIWIFAALGTVALVAGSRAYLKVSQEAAREKQSRIATERDLSETRNEHAEHIATLAWQRTQEITALMEQYTDQITALKTQQTDQITVLKTQQTDQITALKTQQTEQLTAVKAQYDKALDHMRGLEKIFEQRKIAFPWLCEAIADFNGLEAEQDARWLGRKKHRAIVASKLVAEHAAKRREAQREARLNHYRVAYYEKLFPWLADFVGDDVPDEAVQVNETAEPTDDTVRLWLTEAEYKNLSTAEKNQMALDRWKRKTRRSNWEIGRAYERFIGYTYESRGEGYDVLYTGAVEGFADMGRDLIIRRGDECRIIQCKYWSQNKTIHEKHIFQLFGSALEYAFKLGVPLRQVTAVLHTSTKLSDVAKEAAKALHVEFHENIGMSDYPEIKCNINRGEKIYHLPFDQMYDRTQIKNSGERYCYTVAEAEQAGFRRAWKWQGNTKDTTAPQKQIASG